MNKDLNKPTFSDENIKSLYDASVQALPYL